MSKQEAGIKNAYCPRIAFVILLSVKNANPNGDPLAANYPRQGFDGRGKVSAVCIKRKIRDRLQEMGSDIYIISDDRSTDGIHSINGRLSANPEVAAALKTRDSEKIREAVLSSYLDARAFGGVIAGFKDKDTKGVSVGIRGAISIQDAYSVDPIVVTEDQIVKSVNGQGEEGIASDRMGRKYSVDYGLYVIKGSVNPFFAEKNGFTKEDWENCRQAIINLCENDESAARPAGTMAVKEAVFFEGDVTNNGLSRLFDSVKVERRTDAPAACFEDYEITVEPVDGFTPEVITF